VATLITGSGVDKVIDGSIVDADIVGVSSSKLTGALPAVDGSAVTGLTSANLTGALPVLDGSNLTNMAAGGKVLQVVSSAYGGYASSNITTYADTGLSLSITPSATTSRVLVFTTQEVGQVTGTAVGYGNNTNMGLQLVRGSTALITPTVDSGGKYSLAVAAGNTSSGNLMIAGVLSFSYTDSPSTTSATTYKTQLAKGTSGMGPAYTQKGYITLMEIGA
jgi:hypothetical protein